METSLYNAITEFLMNLPNLQSQAGRQALLLAAGLNELMPHVPLGGSTQEFVAPLMYHLEKYGDFPDGTPAVIRLLEAAMNVVGAERRHQLQDLCEQYRQDWQNADSAGKAYDPTLRPEETALRNAYLHRLIRKAGYVPLADIDPQMAGAEIESSLNLNAIYTALLTLSPKEYEYFQDNELPKQRMSALAQVNQHQHLVLLGGPGSGKSTFINFVAICLAGEWLQHRDINVELLTAPLPEEDNKESQQPQSWQHGALLPVRVILREFAATGLPLDGETATAEHLWQFIAKELEREGSGGFVPLLKQHLLQQGGIIFLDGLDEVPETERVRNLIKQVVGDYACLFPKCHIVVTSRTYAYQRREWKLSEFAETVLSVFTEPQINAFVTHWYAYIARLRGMNTHECQNQIDELLRSICQSSRLRELAERPILLTLMTSLHASRGRLPEKPVELYKETVGLLLHRWEWHKFTHANPQGEIVTEYQSLLQWLDVDRDKVLLFLGELAYHAHAAQVVPFDGTARISEDALVAGLWRLSKAQSAGKAQRITVEQVEKHLRDRAGLLVSPDEGVYTFPHRSFQEYLTAVYLTRQQDYPDNMADLVRSDPNRWREVTLLAAASAANVAPMIWLLVDALCFQDCTANVPFAEDDAWGALLAGRALMESADLTDVRAHNQQKLDRVRDWMVAILTEKQPREAPFPAVERALAGNILAQFGDPRLGVVLRDDGLPDIVWCEIPEGEFLMGSESDYVETEFARFEPSLETCNLGIKDKKKYEDVFFSEHPQHTVFLSTFSISRYPVTNAQYQEFIKDGGYTKPIYWTGEGWAWKEVGTITGPEQYNAEFHIANHPVVGVSWYEAVAFCSWLTVRLQQCKDLSEAEEIRLPTEAEWEKAARDIDGRIYPWGNEELTPQYANYSDTQLGVTSPVGGFPCGISPYECEEMMGNVWEWCWDWWGKNYYKNSPQKNPWGPDKGLRRINRGGAWYYRAERVRVANRRTSEPNAREPRVGFRVVRAHA